MDTELKVQRSMKTIYFFIAKLLCVVFMTLPLYYMDVRKYCSMFKELRAINFKLKIQKIKNI